jgi:hypothetical protein
MKIFLPIMLVLFLMEKISIKVLRTAWEMGRCMVSAFFGNRHFVKEVGLRTSKRSSE